MFENDNNNNTPVNAAETPENTVSGVEKVAKKGKGKKIAIGAGIAGAVLVGGGIAAFNFSPLVENQVRKHIMSDEKYYAWVNEENAETLAKKISEDYKLSLDNYENGVKGNVAFIYEPTDEVKSMLTEELEGVDEPETQQLIDIIEGIGSIEIGADYNSKKGAAQYSTYAKLNDEQLITFDVLSDLDSMNVYARIPELTETWLTMPLESWMEAAADESGSSYEYQQFEQYKDVIEDIVKDPKSYLSPEELEKEVARYVGVWNDTVGSSAEVENSETISILDIEQKFSVSTVKFDGELIGKLAKNFVKEFKNDDVIKDIVCDKVGLVDEDDYKDTIDMLVDEIDEASEELEDNDELEFKLMTYIDAKGVIRGFEVKHEEGNGRFIIGKDGDKVRGEAYLEADDEELFRAELKADEKDKKYTGNLDVIADDEDVFSLEFDNFEVVNEEKGFVSGTVTAVIPDIDPITLELKATKDSQAISYDINFDDTDYGTITLSITQKDKADVEVPADSDTFVIDPDSLEDIDFTKYVSKDDVEDFIKNLLTGIGFDDKTAADAAKEGADGLYEGIADLGDELA